VLLRVGWLVLPWFGLVCCVTIMPVEWSGVEWSGVTQFSAKECIKEGSEVWCGVVVQWDSVHVSQ
jgi:hypothetical protein